MRVDQAYPPFIQNIQRDLSLMRSCKYNGTTRAYHGNKVYIEKSMAIQRDLHDHHLDNFIRELENMHSRSCSHHKKINQKSNRFSAALWESQKQILL